MNRGFATALGIAARFQGDAFESARKDLLCDAKSRRHDRHGEPSEVPEDWLSAKNRPLETEENHSMSVTTATEGDLLGRFTWNSTRGYEAGKMHPLKVRRSD
jgi:hypothetical protein